MKLKHFRLQKPDAGDDAGSGPVDRGDEFVPTGSDAPVPKAGDTIEADAEALKATLEAAKPEAAKDEADGEDEADDKKGKKDTRIPLSRHKEILEREREQRAVVERQLAQFQHGDQIANVNEAITKLENSVLALEKDYAQQLTDGEIDKATATMAKIRTSERDMAEAKSDMKIQAAESRAIERTRYATALERIETAYPVLNEDHDDYDKELMSEVIDLKDAYQLKGLTPTLAMQKAVKLMVEPRTSRQEIAVNSSPRVGAGDAKADAAGRKKDAVNKTVDAVTKTPPSLKDVGKDSDKLGGGRLDIHAVMHMSQKEFAALDEKTIELMRGDTL
ncbi:MAG: hypothetical protein Q8N51_05740 [Gammaproteobacteria bacterium]|nr:hypothetical protein [Gammaproteobacteria bacterium]